MKSIKRKKGFFASVRDGIIGYFKFIGNGVVSIYKKFINSCKNFYHRFVDGSLGTKMSHFIMGAGNFYHKRIVKGILYLLIQVGFFAVMIISPEVNGTPIGFKAINNFRTLGSEVGGIWTQTDNSMLMLLFGVVTFGIIAVFIFTYLSNIKSAYLADTLVKEGEEPNTFKEDLQTLVDERFHVTMLMPAILGIITFTILPTIFMILIAFTDYDSSVIAGQHLFNWVGIENFASIFSGKGEIAVRFLPVLSWTLVWAVIATFSCYIGGILVALLINGKNIKFKKVWRTIFMLTIAIPQFVSLLAVRQILAKTGPVNSMLVSSGLISEGIEFLSFASNGITPKVMVLLINLWVGIPFTLLMTTGILMNIPKDLYEAAEIDGASKIQVFFKVTLPYIVFITTPYLISSFVGNITSFNIIFLLTGGGPVVPGYFAGETDLLVTWLYKLTIDQGDYNQGAVIGIITFLLVATGTLLTYRRSKSFKEEDTFQ